MVPTATLNAGGSLLAPNGGGGSLEATEANAGGSLETAEPKAGGGSLVRLKAGGGGLSAGGLKSEEAGVCLVRGVLVLPPDTENEKLEESGAGADTDLTGDTDAAADDVTDGS